MAVTEPPGGLGRVEVTGTAERRTTAVVISAKAAGQRQGCVGLPRGRGAAGFLWRRRGLGGFAQRHCREADLSLLTLSEFSADLGSVLERRDGVNTQTEPAGDRNFKSQEKVFPRPG